LLSHTSGMPAYNAFFDSLRNAEPSRVFTNSDFISGLNANKKPLIYHPGESWNYDNTNFIVLALILEKVSGESYKDYIEKHILQPARMNQTYFFPYLFDSSKNKIKNPVIPHWYPQIYADEPIRADSISFIANYWKAYQFSGFGDYVSTTHDLLKYDQALYNGTLVSEKVLNEAFMPVKLNNGKENVGNYGLGWTISLDNSFGKTVFHVGGAIGLSSVLYRNVTKNQTVIAFDLAHPSANYIAANALKILNNQQISLPKKKLSRIYGKLLTTKGKDVGAQALDELSKDTTNYELDKEDLIKLGYEFLGDVNPFHLKFTPQYEEALEVFKQCVRLFPDYWNSYDSYGDALARTGNKELAIKMYQKSLELKPDSESGKKALQKLLEEKNK
jgi:CubicO group peptidase (beta-lactamase class C family)